MGVLADTITSAAQISLQSQFNILKIILTNKGVGNNTVQIYLSTGSKNIWLAPYNMLLGVGEGYQDEDIQIQSGESINIVPTDTLDYYILTDQ
jgi:hypothetical protein